MGLCTTDAAITLKRKTLFLLLLSRLEATELTFTTTEGTCILMFHVEKQEKWFLHQKKRLFSFSCSV